jgi:hypothetical protein
VNRGNFKKTSETFLGETGIHSKKKVAEIHVAEAPGSGPQKY